MTPRTPSPPGDVLRRGGRWLDFDGTLVEIAPTPDAVPVGASLFAVLSVPGDRIAGDGRVLPPPARMDCAVKPRVADKGADKGTAVAALRGPAGVPAWLALRPGEADDAAAA